MDHTLLRPNRKDAPCVQRIQTSTGYSVRKSYENCSALLRETVGRWAIGRECWALEKLSASSHTPTLLSRPNRYTMVCEFVEGTPLEQLNPKSINLQELRKQAESLLADLEEVRVAHGDLGHDHWQAMGRESNLIWTPDERLVAIDFAGALPLDSQWPIFRSLGAALRCHDLLLRDKLQHHFPGFPQGPAVGLDWPMSLWDLLRTLGKI